MSAVFLLALLSADAGLQDFVQFVREWAIQIPKAGHVSIGDQGTQCVGKFLGHFECHLASGLAANGFLVANENTAVQRTVEVDIPAHDRNAEIRNPGAFGYLAVITSMNPTLSGLLPFASQARM